MKRFLNNLVAVDPAGAVGVVCPDVALVVGFALNVHFVGINPEITLRPHQVNAIAHILYGGNTLLAHLGGAGKTLDSISRRCCSRRYRWRSTLTGIFSNCECPMMMAS